MGGRGCTGSQEAGRGLLGARQEILHNMVISQDIYQFLDSTHAVLILPVAWLLIQLPEVAFHLCPACSRGCSTGLCMLAME